MRFVAKRDDLLNGIKIVERATVVKGLQPVLSNVLIESIGESQLKLTATDFDFSITTMIDANIEEEGKTTLPAKKLLEILSRLQDELVKIDQSGATATITCKNAKFDIISISANEFPQVDEIISEDDSVEIDTVQFTKAVRQVISASAGYETNSLLSGISLKVDKNILEMAATDGNRLARVREIVKNNLSNEDNLFELLLSSKIFAELLKISLLTESESIKICKENKKIVIMMNQTKIIAKLMQGQFPKYNQLIPQTFAKEAIIDRMDLISAIERVSIMVDEKIAGVKFEICDNELKLSGDSPDAGNSTDTIEIKYSGEPITIAFNYKFVLEFLKTAETEDITIKLNTPLSATVYVPNSDEDFIYLIMPVQLRS